MTEWTKDQRKAIDLSGTNIIVSAGAGSGKTAVLTERVLEKVKNGISLSHLLILTFTNLAAQEMRERIYEKLKKEGQLGELENLPAADISTFDSYALSLVKKYHYYLNVSRNIGIIDSSVIELYKINTLDTIFETLYAKKDEAFLSLIKTYFLKDDRELKEYLLELDRKLDLKPDKRSYLDSYITKFYTKEKINYDIEIYTNEMQKIIDKINTYLDYVDDEAFLSKLSSSLDSLLLSTTYDEIKNNLDLIKLPQARGVSDASKEAKKKIENALSELNKACSYENQKKIEDSIFETQNYVSVIIDIIKKLDAEVTAYKKKYDYYEYHDIANLAIKLVKENHEIRDEIKNNLNEILIDEYQDTNDIQEEFISYISHNNVYMVGDIKQSIYRFRNANPYIFKKKYDAYANDLGGIKIDLNKNFRSRNEVISNINMLFNMLMDDNLGGANYRIDHQMVYGNVTYDQKGFTEQNNNFEVYNYLNDTNFKKEEIESFIIAQDIRDKIDHNYKVYDRKLDKLRTVKYSDFVILIDSSKNFELIKKILEYHDIKVSIMKKGNLIDSEIVYIIKNIISFILKIQKQEFDKEFERLFMSLGRSFLFQIDDSHLFDYFYHKNFKDSDIYLLASSISKSLDDLALDNLLDIIITKYQFNEKLITIGNYHSNILCLEKLKEITSNLVMLNYSIYDYQKYLEDITKNKLKIEYELNDIGTDTVKIMTIHASKGLEFNICYFAGLYGGFNIRDATKRFSYDEEYGIIIPYRDDYIKNTIYHKLNYRNYVKENIGERLRLFYVALTRAREKMIFLLPKMVQDNASSFGDIIDIDIRSKYNSFASILYSLDSLTKNYCKDIDIDSLNLTKDYNLLKNNDYQKEIASCDEKIIVKELNISPLGEEEKSFSKKIKRLINYEEEEKLSYGRHLHELLELTDFNNPDLTSLSEKEKTIILNLLSQIDLRGANVYKEYEFIYDEDDITYHGIIDLMLEYEDRIVIIDYKLKNITDDEYLKQLNGYRHYISHKFKKDTEIMLYSITQNILQKI